MRRVPKGSSCIKSGEGSSIFEIAFFEIASPCYRHLTSGVSTTCPSCPRGATDFRRSSRCVISVTLVMSPFVSDGTSVVASAISRSLTVRLGSPRAVWRLQLHARPNARFWLGQPRPYPRLYRRRKEAPTVHGNRATVSTAVIYRLTGSSRSGVPEKKKNRGTRLIAVNSPSRFSS